MSKIITVFIELMSATLEWLHTNLDGIIVSIVAAVILSLIHYIKNKPKEINELLKCKNFNDINWIDDLDKSLEIKNTMKRHFPEYTDYLLIQYGSSVESNNRLPQDYDFIVLMLGIPKNGKRYLHNKGTTSPDDVSSKRNINQVDIVYRDYLSFLYAASAGMPYENTFFILSKSSAYRFCKMRKRSDLFPKKYKRISVYIIFHLGRSTCTLYMICGG